MVRQVHVLTCDSVFARLLEDRLAVTRPGERRRLNHCYPNECRHGLHWRGGPPVGAAMQERLRRARAQPYEWRSPAEG